MNPPRPNNSGDRERLTVSMKSRGHSRVLDSIRERMPNHPQFVRHVADHDESRFEYRFSLPGNPGREIRLTVQACHIPKWDLGRN